MPNTIQRSSNAEDSVGVTEIIVPNNGEGMRLILPMLAYLSQQCALKWFTWIAPGNVSKPLLTAHGFALDNVRLVHTEDDEASMWMLWDALANGNSANVVANIDTLSEADRNKLENASRLGNTRALVLRARG